MNDVPTTEPVFLSPTLPGGGTDVNGYETVDGYVGRHQEDQTYGLIDRAEPASYTGENDHTGFDPDSDPDCAGEVEREPRPGEPKFYRLSELDQLPKQAWIYDQEGVQIPAHAITLLVGESGAGKSYVAFHWALEIAQRVPVVYVAAEKLQLYPARCQAWHEYHHTPLTEDFYLYNREIDLSKQDDVAQFVADCRDLRPQLVIIDTLARCTGDGDENSAQDMGQVIQQCERLKRELQCAVFLVHHSGKNGQGARGSSALVAACDCEISLSRRGSLIALKNTKQSGALEFEEVHYRLVPVEIPQGDDPPVTNCVVVPCADKSSTDKGATATKNRRTLLEALARNPDGLTQSRLKAEAKMGSSSVKNAVDPLIKAGLVRHEARGPYFITDAGSKVLQGERDDTAKPVQ